MKPSSCTLALFPMLCIAAVAQSATPTVLMPPALRAFYRGANAERCWNRIEGSRICLIIDPALRDPSRLGQILAGTASGPNALNPSELATLAETQYSDRLPIAYTTLRRRCQDLLREFFREDNITQPTDISALTCLNDPKLAPVVCAVDAQLAVQAGDQVAPRLRLTLSVRLARFSWNTGVPTLCDLIFADFAAAERPMPWRPERAGVQPTGIVTTFDELVTSALGDIALSMFGTKRLVQPPPIEASTQPRSWSETSARLWLGASISEPLTNEGAR